MASSALNSASALLPTDDVDAGAAVGVGTDGSGAGFSVGDGVSEVRAADCDKACLDKLTESFAEAVGVAGVVGVTACCVRVADWNAVTLIEL